MPDELHLFVIYKNPTDYPGRFVVREFVLAKPAPSPLAVVGSLMEARAALPPGLVRLAPSALDEPHIVEVWL